jgi:hypothetical protein
MFFATPFEHMYFVIIKGDPHQERPKEKLAKSHWTGTSEAKFTAAWLRELTA